MIAAVPRLTESGGVLIRQGVRSLQNAGDIPPVWKNWLA